MPLDRSYRHVVTDDLARTHAFTLERAEGDGEQGDGLTLSGHAAVFNVKTLIDSWEGRFEEQIAPGAFRRSFRDRTPVLQFDHGKHPVVGSIPIGMINRAEEDDVGAFVEARLHDNWATQPVRDAIESGSISGMSFRFTVVREDWHGEDGRKIKDHTELMDILWSGSETPTRTLREVKVPELGPVVFPAYEATDVGLRSGDTKVVIDLARLRSDPEEARRLGRILWMADTIEAARRRSEPAPDVPESAPPAGGHPDEDDDAPPAVGHPSDNPNPQGSRDAEVAQMLGRMQVTLARVHGRN